MGAACQAGIAVDLIVALAVTRLPAWAVAQKPPSLALRTACDQLNHATLKEFMCEAQRDSAIVEYEMVAGIVRKASTKIAISRKR